MGVLRENKESLMAVLEAFVYDPLINWRLMQADVDTRRPEGWTVHFCDITFADKSFSQQIARLIPSGLPS